MAIEGARMARGADGIFDFEELVVEPRLVRVGGEIADVAIMPVGVAMAIAKMADRTRDEVVAAAEEGNGEAEIRRVATMISQVCLPSNPKFTPEFILENLTSAKFRAFARFVLQPYQDEEPTEEDDSGNPTSSE